MGGLISRDAAKEAVKEFFKAQVDAIPKDTDFEVVTNTCDLILKHNAGVLKAVDTLPTIEPSTNRSEIPNSSDTISRQAAIDALRTCYETETVTMDDGDEYINYEDAVGEIEQLPSAQPEIIRCRDCKHRPTRDKDGWLDFPTERCPCQNEDDFYYSWMPKDDWFCGNAERRR